MEELAKKILGRNESYFLKDLKKHEQLLSKRVSVSKFLVIGGAGTIGKSTVKEIFKRSPLKLHVVDISENNLVELIRDIRSSLGYIKGDFKIFALDVGSIEYDCFWENDGDYDYVLNFSAIKHVRSEKDQFTLMRMTQTNIINVQKTLNQCLKKNIKKYFCVSTDKASVPVNMMGASKKIMEHFLEQASQKMDISTARFANVIFSDGSLFSGFEKRLQKNQPLVYPKDIKRYFITPQESGELCLLSSILGKNKQVFFPKTNNNFDLLPIKKIAELYLQEKGFKPIYYTTEEDARYHIKKKLNSKSHWPCKLSISDTSGEKPYEEFFAENEIINYEDYESIGVINLNTDSKNKNLEKFILTIDKIRESGFWKKKDILAAFKLVLKDFNHLERGKYLDQKM